jgi:PiT family inorganic phosphate transporter
MGAGDQGLQGAADLADRRLRRAALLFLLSKWLIKYPALYEAPKGNSRHRGPFALLLVLTCTGVSFFHGSNDGQKGMGLIMLILIGTVPTAYALNHAVSGKGRAGLHRRLRAGRTHPRQHVDKTGILGADARAEVTDYIRTKQMQPDTVLALRELVEDLNHEVALYKEFKSVPAKADQRPQRHVRGQRSDPADAEEPRTRPSRRTRTPL